MSRFGVKLCLHLIYAKALDCGRGLWRWRTEAVMSDPTPEDGGWVLDEYDGPRFWAHVNFHGGRDFLADPLARIGADAGECWLWSGWNSDGYGIIRIWGRIIGAHRVAYRDFGGDLADDQDIDHLCRVHACVRPNHLEPVTHRENILRGANARANR